MALQCRFFCLQRFAFINTVRSVKQKRNCRIQLYSTNVNKTKINVSTWRSLALGCVPLCVCLFCVMQYRRWRQHEGGGGVVVLLFQVLPLRLTSRCWGWAAECQLPTMLRSPLLGLYAKAFQVDLDEAELSDIRQYPSLASLFARSLKEGARPQNLDACLTAPCDGKVLYCGPVRVKDGSIELHQVKGVTYSLDRFLGISPPSNQLYECTVYLAPGDYHRFHSPTEWQAVQRRHFVGKLLTVSPRFASFCDNLFCLNERAAYIGNWKHGFFSLTAIGATNVGSVRVYDDPSLHTNTPLKRKGCCESTKLNHWYKRGDPFGEFRMGSTIVLVFEAPLNFQFNFKPGDIIKVGQALGCIAEEKRQYQR